MALFERTVLTILLSLIAWPIAQAANVEPPTVALSAKTTTIVVAEFKEKGPGDRIVFTRKKVLQTLEEVPEFIDLATPDLRNPLQVGHSYIIAYSPYARDAFERVAKNFRGATILSSPGMSPSLWEYRPAMEQLVQWRIGDETEEELAALPRLLKLLKSGDRAEQDFAAAEIGYRPGLQKSLDAASQKVIQRFVDSKESADVSRAIILLSATNMPELARSAQRWRRIALGLLNRSPVLVASVQDRPALIYAALQYLQIRKIDVPDATLMRWMTGNDLGIVERVVQMIAERGQKTELKALDRALGSRELPDETRAYLEQQRSRLQPEPSPK